MHLLHHPTPTVGRTTFSLILQVREKFMLSSLHLTWLTCTWKPGFRCECGLAADPLATATLSCEPVCTPRSLAAIWTHHCHLWGCLAPEPTQAHGLGASGVAGALSPPSSPIQPQGESGGAAARTTSRHPSINARCANRFPGIHGDVPPRVMTSSDGRTPMTTRTANYVSSQAL